MNKLDEEHLKHRYASGPNHQVIADGEVIYTGPDWQEAFLEAGKHPEYTTIIHLRNGEQGAVLGPVQPHTHPL